MILLLDAHALIWWLAGNPELSEPARRAIADPANTVIASAATIWEIEIKRRKGKLRTPERILDALSPISVVPIEGGDAVAAAALPPHHRDPFDRMLIAHAHRLDAVIVSRDREFTAYDVRQLLA